MTVVSVGVDHERVGLALLEQLTIPGEQWAKVVRALTQDPNVHEAVLVSTCLRTEVYASVERFHGAVEAITAQLAVTTSVPTEQFNDVLTIHFDRGVSSHLFMVAAGLCSAVPGEYEVLGQVRRALELAEAEGTAGDELRPLFQRALAAGRRARHETAIARGTASFASAAVSLAVSECGARLVGGSAVVVGAGQLAGGVARALVARGDLATITVANRTLERAHSLAAQLSDARVVATDLAELADACAGAALIVTAVASAEPIITAHHLTRAPAGVLIMDLGVPRVVAPDVATRPGVRYRDLSDLRDVVRLAADERREAIDAATSIVEVEVERFHEDRRSRGAAEIVSALRERLEALRAGEFERREAEFAHLTDDQRELVDSLTRSVVAKIAHAPTVALKEAAGTDGGHRLTEAVRALFDL
jgi:glutamyl-tRNA reductase